MKQNHYQHLEAMPAFEGQVFDADGTTTLQPEQLEAVEAVLERESQQQATIDNLQARLDESTAQLADRDRRISELESSLAAAQQLIDNPAPQNPKVDHTPEGTQGVETAQDWDSAVKICNGFLGK